MNPKYIREIISWLLLIAMLLEGYLILYKDEIDLFLPYAFFNGLCIIISIVFLYESRHIK